MPQKTVQLPMGTTQVAIGVPQTQVSTVEITPAFVQPLRSEIKVAEHSTLKLECEVVSQSPPAVLWLANGVVIQPSKKYSMYATGTKRVLEVRDVVMEDTGVYTCRITNELGEAVTSTTLYVTGAEKKREPPRFVQQLNNVTAEDGKEVVLSCVVTGIPVPEISWTHNNKNIDKSEDFVITYDKSTGKIDLVIVDCLPDDQGLFRCIAKNALGQAVTQCTLMLRGTPSPMQVSLASPKVHLTDVVVNVGTEIENVETQVVHERMDTVTSQIIKRSSAQPPKFSTPIHPCVVKEGELCTFSAVVAGAPQPEVVWLKDKVPLAPNEHYVTDHDKATNLCTLTINAAKPEDIAVYSCQATNIAGKATCTANVVVVRKYSL